MLILYLQEIFPESVEAYAGDEQKKGGTKKVVGALLMKVHKKIIGDEPAPVALPKGTVMVDFSFQILPLASPRGQINNKYIN